MLTLLSPAKKLDMTPVETGIQATSPRLDADTRELASVAKTKTPGDLKRLMRISDRLAEVNFERFQSFDLENRSNSAKPAGLAFDGDVYWGLEAKSLSDTTLAYAQDHLRILSGLYGVLRPMDMIQPYRLEMGTKLVNPRGKSLYEFWGSKIAEQLNDDLEGHPDPTIVNLASNEYFNAVDTATLGGNVINVKFLNVKDGEARSLMFYAKRARGSMARWIMEKRVDRAVQLKEFNSENYSLDASASTDNDLTFKRQQPPLRG